MRKTSSKEEKYMHAAIREAKKAYALEEVPIGCVIVYEDKIIARGYNRRIRSHTPRCPRLKKRVKSWETGDWKAVRCM